MSKTFFLDLLVGRFDIFGILFFCFLFLFWLLGTLEFEFPFLLIPHSLTVKRNFISFGEVSFLEDLTTPWLLGDAAIHTDVLRQWRFKNNRVGL